MNQKITKLCKVSDNKRKINDLKLKKTKNFANFDKMTKR